MSPIFKLFQAQVAWINHCEWQLNDESQFGACVKIRRFPDFRSPPELQPGASVDCSCGIQHYEGLMGHFCPLICGLHITDSTVKLTHPSLIEPLNTSQLTCTHSNSAEWLFDNAKSVSHLLC